MGFLQDLECHSGTTKESSLPQSPLNIFHPLLNLLSDRIDLGEEGELGAGAVALSLRTSWGKGPRPRDRWAVGATSLWEEGAAPLRGFGNMVISLI